VQQSTYQTGKEMCTLLQITKQIKVMEDGFDSGRFSSTSAEISGAKDCYFINKWQNLEGKIVLFPKILA
jgi:hypothetical protein